MLMFILCLTSFNMCTINFNTSNVNVHRVTNTRKTAAVRISIHLMLMFIQKLMLLRQQEQDFNTSNVNVHPPLLVEDYKLGHLFQYI